jgi:tetratricopeptide (TPR) repeat protein
MLRHRHKLVRFRTSVMNQLHALAMGQGLCRKKKLWAKAGRKELEGLVLDPWASLRRKELLQLLDQLDPWIAKLDEAVIQSAESRPPDDLNKDNSSSTVVKYVVVPSVQALNLIHKNKADEAITALEVGRKYELGQVNGYSTYWIIYVRGLAYLQLKDGPKAAAEFQKILDHRGLNPIHAIPPLAQLNLARAYVLQHDTAKARTAYQDFFALWKDADPDVPVLLAAKSE